MYLALLSAARRQTQPVSVSACARWRCSRSHGVVPLRREMPAAAHGQTSRRTQAHAPAPAWPPGLASGGSDVWGGWAGASLEADLSGGQYQVPARHQVILGHRRLASGGGARLAFPSPACRRVPGWRQSAEPRLHSVACRARHASPSFLQAALGVSAHTLSRGVQGGTRPGLAPTEDMVAAACARGCCCVCARAASSAGCVWAYAHGAPGAVRAAGRLVNSVSMATAEVHTCGVGMGGTWVDGVHGSGAQGGRGARGGERWRGKHVRAVLHGWDVRVWRGSGERRKQQTRTRGPQGAYSRQGRASRTGLARWLAAGRGATALRWGRWGRAGSREPGAGGRPSAGKRGYPAAGSRRDGCAGVCGVRCALPCWASRKRRGARRRVGHCVC